MNNQKNIVMVMNDEEYEFFMSKKGDSGTQEFGNKIAKKAVDIKIEKKEKFNECNFNRVQFRVSDSIHSRLKKKSKELNISIKELFLKGME